MMSHYLTRREEQPPLTERAKLWAGYAAIAAAYFGGGAYLGYRCATTGAPNIEGRPQALAAFTGMFVGGAAFGGTLENKLLDDDEKRGTHPLNRAKVMRGVNVGSLLSTMCASLGWGAGFIYGNMEKHGGQVVTYLQ